MDWLNIPRVVQEPSFERSKDFNQGAWDKKHKCQSCGKKTYYKELTNGYICSSCFKKMFG